MEALVGLYRLGCGAYFLLIMSFGFITSWIMHKERYPLPGSDPQEFELLITERPEKAHRLMLNYLKSGDVAHDKAKTVQAMTDGSIQLILHSPGKKPLVTASVKFEPLDGGTQSNAVIAYDVTGLAWLGEGQSMAGYNAAAEAEFRRGLVAIDEGRVIERGFSVMRIASTAPSYGRSYD
jgi:hypothetical protein